MALPLRHANNGPVTWTHVLRQCSITPHPLPVLTGQVSSLPSY